MYGRRERAEGFLGRLEELGGASRAVHEETVRKRVLWCSGESRRASRSRRVSGRREGCRRRKKARQTSIRRVLVPVSSVSRNEAMWSVANRRRSPRRGLLPPQLPIPPAGLLKGSSIALTTAGQECSAPCPSCDLVSPPQLFISYRGRRRQLGEGILLANGTATRGG